MGTIELCTRISIAPWAKNCLWVLCKIGMVTVPLFGERHIIKSAAWIVDKGAKFEVVSEKG